MQNPSTFFKLPVIGIIVTREMTYTITNNDNTIEKLTIPPEEFEIIAEEKTFYVCNQWYKEHNNTPQLIAKEMVASVSLFKE